MITPQEFEASIKNEHRLIRHLYTLIDKDKLDYRFSAKQRTTLELLQYLSTLSAGFLRMVHEGKTDSWMQIGERQKQVTYENFLQKLTEEEKEVDALLKKFTEEELNTPIELFMKGHPQRKAMYLIDILRNLSAYRMQLFLQIKAAGREDIGTMDLWAGMPTPKKH